MTTLERAQALQDFGYDADEAQFLCIAALHGGYFLRRQFLSFVRGTKGWKDVTLINKLSANEHCRINVYRHERMVYHLSSKPIYEALGEPNNRNRRQHQPATIKGKIMALDFVLEHPTFDFLATERFVESYPISIQDGANGDPISHFCYVDEGLQSTDRFATYLSQYRRLFRTLGHYQVIYVAEDSRLFASAERVFQKFVESISALPEAISLEDERLLT